MASNQRARPLRGPGAAAVVLERIEIRRLGALTELQVEPTPTGDERGQWIVVLGDNGSGKTSLLRGIALAAATGAYAIRAFQDVEPSFVHLAEGAGFESRATAKIFGRQRMISASRRPGAPVVTLSADRPDGDRHPDDPDVFAYGSRRGDALGGLDRDVPLEGHRTISTLFNGHSRLVHAETWLRREKLRASVDHAFFTAILDTVSSLLPDGDRLRVIDDEVMIESALGHRFPFAAMSDGYLTTLGWTIDLIARWANLYRDTGTLDENFAKDMPCLVLVDELDLHLHPRWQLDIIPRLRAAFPKTTFVVTTHNPLTLQGTRPGEVFVLERDAEGTIGITQRDIMPGLDANRILTDWFGLPTTLDNDTRDLMAEHLKLLWEKVPESHARRRALERTLRDRLGRYADTSLERIAQSVIAEVLHKKTGGPLADITPEDRSEIVTQVEARLDVLDAPPATSSAREPAPTWRRKTTSKPRKATTTRKTAPKRKGTTAGKPATKR